MAHAGSAYIDETSSRRALRSLSSALRGGVAAAGGFTTLRCAIMLAVDAVATVFALRAALWLRFDADVPAEYLRIFPAAAGLLVVARLSCNAFLRLHRWSFRLAGFAEALRVIASALAGALLFAAASVAAGLRLPRTVYALELLVAATAFGLVRFLPRAGLRWTAARSLAGAPPPAIDPLRPTPAPGPGVAF